MTRSDLLALARRLGFEVSITARSHLRFRHPQGGELIVASGTPSCARSWRNTAADLHRVHRTQVSIAPVEKGQSPPRKDRPTALQRLRAAWASASPAERQAFVVHDLPQRASR